jgi:hypothetical protein
MLLPEKNCNTVSRAVTRRSNPLGSHFSQSCVTRQLPMLSGRLTYQGKITRTVRSIIIAKWFRRRFPGLRHRGKGRANLARCPSIIVFLRFAAINPF